MLCLFLFQQEMNFVSATGDTVMIKTDITIKRALFFFCMLSQLSKIAFWHVTTQTLHERESYEHMK